MHGLRHTLHAINLATKTGKPVALDVHVDDATLEALAFTLDCSVSFSELPGGGELIEGKGAGGEFTLTLAPKAF
jgi:hypothetical protein